MLGTKYLSDLVSLDMLKKDRLNIIKSPTGSGKTYFALNKIPKTVQGATYKIVYLIDTINGKEQILQNYNAVDHSQRWERQVTEDWIYFTGLKENPDIVVITYAKFGVILERNPDFHKNFEYIICDELPSLIKYQYFSPRPNAHSIAKHGLERAVQNDRSTVIGLSATPFLIYKEFEESLTYDVPIDQKEVRQYETKDHFWYNDLEYLLSTLDQSETGICYTSRITLMQHLENRARELGFNPVSFWSIRNTDHHMTDEQLAVRKSILDSFILPPQYNLLFINASSETSLKIKSPVDYVIVHSNNNDVQVQVRGRVNSDLSKIYLPENNPNDLLFLNVPSEFLNRKLFADDKRLLCETLNIRNQNNRLFGWATIKEKLIDCDYLISEGRDRNQRYAIISPPQ